MPPRKMPNRRKKRVQLGIIVSKATKEDIAARAHDTGVSQGQLCENLIEKGLAYDRMLLEIWWKLERMEKEPA